MKLGMTNWSPALDMLLCLVAATLAGTARSAGSAPEIALRVVPAQPLGELPRTYRSPVMVAWADAEAVNAFLSLPGSLGAMRAGLEQLLADASNLAEFSAVLARNAGRLKRLSERGADIVVTVAEGVGALATAAPQCIVLLVHRYGSDPLAAATRSLRQSGFRARDRTYRPHGEEIKAFVGRKAGLPAGCATPAVQAVLKRAWAAFDRARDAPASEVVVHPAVAGAPPGGNYRLYWTDELKCNPGAVHRKHRREDRPHEEARGPRAARMRSGRKGEGGGLPPPLCFGTYGAVLIENDLGLAT